MKKTVSKPIPPRSRKIAEDYAKKVRIEPPKGTRQDPGLDVAKPSRPNTAGSHDHGPPQEPKNAKFPRGGKERGDGK